MDCSVILAIAIACVSPVPAGAPAPPPAVWQPYEDLDNQFHADLQRRVAAGEITPAEANSLRDLLQQYRRWEREQAESWRNQGPRR